MNRLVLHVKIEYVLKLSYLNILSPFFLFNDTSNTAPLYYFADERLEKQMAFAWPNSPLNNVRLRKEKALLYVEVDGHENTSRWR